MRSLNLEIPEKERIEINGDIFEINISDADILNKCADFEKKYARLTHGDIESVRSAANEIIAYVDEILGEGAASKISRGAPVNIVAACKWLIAICGEIGKIQAEKDKENDDYIAGKYE